MRANRSIQTFSALLIALAFFAPLYAEDGSDDQGVDLPKLYAEIETAKLDLEKVKLRSEELSSAQKKLSAEVQSLKTEEAALLAGLEEANLQKRKVEADLAALDKELLKSKELTLKRLKAWYMSQSAESPQSLLRVSAELDPSKMAFFYHKIRGFDRGMIEELSWLGKRRESEAAQLSNLVSKRESLQVQVKLQRESLDKKFNQQKKILGEAEAEKKKLTAALAKLKAQALRLETVVASLTEEAAETESLIEKSPKIPSRAPAESRDLTRKYDGPGLFRLKGSLVLPIEGAVIRAFGKSKHADFEDFVFNKGYEFLAEAGEEVIAIAPGRVIHKGLLPGFGLVTILDHGERSYSLYGKLGSSSVEVGDELDKGDSLGSASDVEKGKGNFYFEIRLNGEPVDPQSYYKQRL